MFPLAMNVVLFLLGLANLTMGLGYIMPFKAAFSISVGISCFIAMLFKA